MLQDLLRHFICGRIDLWAEYKHQVCPDETDESCKYVKQHLCLFTAQEVLLNFIRDKFHIYSAAIQGSYSYIDAIRDDNERNHEAHQFFQRKN